MDIRPGSSLEGPNGSSIIIQRVIGKGGFGLVLEGELPNGNKVAVKTMLTTALSDAELRTLQNEIRLAGEIVHPNVVRVLHVNGGTGRGIPPYLVMELVTGGSLRGLLGGRTSTNTHFAPDELQAIFQQLAFGMQAINEKLVHRDLKPENILIDGAGVLKISDFGLAKLADAATRTETFKGWGTPPYMAPEAFEGTANTVAMDVYAMGVIFHELATLQLPILPKAGDMTALRWARAHLTQAPADIRTARPDLPVAFHQLIIQMLQKDPTKRPSAWSQVLERLQGSASAPTANMPDVAKLVERATISYQESAAAEARAREDRERQAERLAILELAAREPLELFQSVVQAFNSSTAVGKLAYTELGLGAEIAALSGARQRLRVEIQIGEEIELRPNGFVRMLGAVRLSPGPTAREALGAHFDRQSFGGFNLAYWVPNRESRYGSWRQYRFEVSPLINRMRNTRWFALGFDLLPRQMRLLQAMGEYQHETRALDDEWFKALLFQLL